MQQKEALSFLFLQGPGSLFFNDLGRALRDHGHRVHRINLHLGEQLFWRLPATNYRGRFDEWRSFVARTLEDHRVTHVILHGDQRPYHIVAAEEARRLGKTVVATDLGYLRPDWITLEYDGMTTYSRFPRDPAAIRKLAKGLPQPELQWRFYTPFLLLAFLDVIFNLALVFGRPLYPCYRQHGIFHPLAEYAGWILAMLRRRWRAAIDAAAKEQLQRETGSYFLLPLQLATDFQIRAHSPYADAREGLREVIASFAASGSSRKLVVVAHPLDNGLIRWDRLTRAWAAQYGVADRVVALENGVPDDLLRNAAGVVTINSTLGLTALRQGVPVKVLGNAVFDVPGMTHQGGLDTFWTDPTRPDRPLTGAFIRGLAFTTQIKGSYYLPGARGVAVATAVERLEGSLYRLPALTAGDLRGRQVRPSACHIAIIGAADGIGLALARAYAAPGVCLILVATDAAALAAAADDCRRRGAAVETRCRAWHECDAAAADLTEFDRQTAALDVVVDAGLANRPQLPAGVWEQATHKTLGPIAEQMRARGRGRIALVGGPADGGRLSYGEVLRSRLRGQSVSVSVAGPSPTAARLPRRFRDPRLTAISDDRAARLIRRGISLGRERIAVPGALTPLTRGLAAGAKRLCAWIPAVPVAAPGLTVETMIADVPPFPQEASAGD